MIVFKRGWLKTIEYKTEYMGEPVTLSCFYIISVIGENYDYNDEQIVTGYNFPLNAKTDLEREIYNTLVALPSADNKNGNLSNRSESHWSLINIINSLSKLSSYDKTEINYVIDYVLDPADPRTQDIMAVREQLEWCRPGVSCDMGLIMI